MTTHKTEGLPPQEGKPRHIYITKRNKGISTMDYANYFSINLTTGQLYLWHTHEQMSDHYAIHLDTIKRWTCDVHQQPSLRTNRGSLNIMGKIVLGQVGSDGKCIFSKPMLNLLQKNNLSSLGNATAEVCEANERKAETYAEELAHQLFGG